MAKQSSMIRDLVINVKANDLSKTATEAEKLVAALVDAAEGGEKLTVEFNSVKTSLLSVNKAANTTLDIFNNFNLNNKFKSSLNQVLEGVNRISAAAKDLKGLNIGVSVKVDNLTQLKNDVSKSVQGLDISINLKAGNLTATNDRMQAIVVSMQDAAAGVALLNSELTETKTLVASIKTDADAAAYSLAKVAISKNLENGLDDVLHALNMISEEIVQLNLDSKDSFADMTNAIDRTDDSLGAINKTLHQTKFATKEVGTNTKVLVDSFGNVSRESVGMEQKVADATRGMRNQSRMMGDLAKLAGPIPAAFAIISAHVWALTSAFDQLAAGDQLNRLEDIGTTIGAHVGVPVQNVARLMVEATNGAISYSAALKKAANASAYGFTTDELEKMTVVARRAAVVMGVEMDDALNRILKGVSKQEIELLDELGITVRLTEAQNIYAKSIGKTATQLTSYEKQQAYLNAVLKQSEASFGFLTKEDLGATNIERMGAAFRSWTDAILQTVAALSNKALAPFMFDTDTEKHIAGVAKKTEYLATSLNSVQKAMSNGGGGIAAVIRLAADGWERFNETDSDQKALKSRIDTLNKLRKASLDVNSTNMSMKPPTIGGNLHGGLTMQQPEVLNIVSFSKENEAELATAYASLSEIETAHNKLIDKTRNSLGLEKLSYVELGAALKALNPIMTEYMVSKHTSVSGVKELMQTLMKESDSLLSETSKSALKYDQSLNDILDLYIKLDKFEELFPAVPKSTLNSLRSLVDEMAKAAGFKNRIEIEVAYKDSSAYRDFTEKHKFDANKVAQDAISSRGSISGTNELKQAKLKLQTSKEELDVSQKMFTSGKMSAESLGARKKLELEVLTNTKAVLDAEQSLALVKEGMAEQDTRRNNLYMQYSKMSDSEYQLAALKNELTDREKLLDTQKKYSVNADIQYQTKTDIMETEYKINAATVANKLAQEDYTLSLKDGEAAGNVFLAYMAGIPIEITQATLAQHELNAAIAKAKEIESAFNKGDSGVKAEQVVAAKTAVQQAKLAEMKAAEAAIEAQANKDSLNLQIKTADLNLGELEVAKNQEIIEAKHLQNLKDTHASQTAILNQTLAEAEARRKIADIENERHRAAVEGGIGAIQGENQMQYTSTTGMGEEAKKLAKDSDSLANVANSFDQLAAYDQPFANVAANLSQMAIAIQDNASAMQIASMAGQTITSMFQMNGQAAVDAIDAQIAAEKKRDGTSEESLAKIKALEAKKIETTRKTARQTIIMQTAVGVANALAMGNPLIGIPMAIAVGAMGLQALKAADSAAESSLAGLDSSATTGSLTLGDRTNKVDTAQIATSGELSYIQGSNGTGGIQNFTPRAAGGNANAGYSYIAGEKGPELITPKIDSVVSDAQATRGGSASIGGITLNVNAIDARSFQDLVYANPQVFKDAVEMSLNQQGKTLY